MNIDANNSQQSMTRSNPKCVKIIHYDKVGFMSIKDGCFNIQKSINMFYPINTLKEKNGTLTSTYAGKHV